VVFVGNQHRDRSFDEAKKTKRPVAVLVADEYHGFNR